MSHRAGPPTIVHHVSLAIVQLCFGLFPVIGRIAFDGGLAASTVAAWRIAVGSMVLGAMAFAIHGKGAIPRREDLLRMIVASALGIAINQLCFLEGLKRSPPVNAGLMIGLIPAMTYLVALVAGHERIDRRRALGIVIGGAAVMQLIIVDASHLLGNVLLFANMLVYSVYLVVSRPLLARYPAIVVTAWMFMLSTWMLPISAADADPFPASATNAAWWALAFIVIFPTIIGYLLNLFAMTRLPSSTAGTYTFSQPVLVIATGIAIHGDEVTVANVIATAGVMAAMWLVLKTPNRPPSPDTPDTSVLQATPSAER